VIRRKLVRVAIADRAAESALYRVPLRLDSERRPSSAG